MGFPSQEYWSGLSFPSLGDVPDPGIKPTSPALQVGSLLLCLQGSPIIPTGIICPLLLGWGYSVELPAQEHSPPIQEQLPKEANR